MKGLITVCSKCGHKTEPREISIEFERKGVRAVMSGIPAMVCPRCGEEYVPADIAGDVIETVTHVIDETEGMLKRTETHRQELVPENQSTSKERLKLALV